MAELLGEDCEFKVFDFIEMTSIADHEWLIESDGGGGDPKVILADASVVFLFLKLCANFCVNQNDWLCVPNGNP
jgi:hypothetical protein